MGFLAAIRKASGNVTVHGVQCQENATAHGVQLAPRGTAIILAERMPAGIVQAADPTRARTDDTWLGATAKQRTLAVERRDAAREFYRMTADGMTAAEAESRIRTMTFRFPMLMVGGHGGANALTATNMRRWIKTLGRKPGQRDPDWLNLAAMLDKRKECSGRPGPEKVFKEFMPFYARCYEDQNQRDHSVAYWEARARALQAGLHQEMLPSLRSVIRYYNLHIHTGSLSMARAKSRDEITALRPHALRDPESIQPGEALVADSHTLDLECRYWDEEKKAWAACRPILVGFMDIRSKKMVGWVLTADKSPNRFNIMQALAVALLESDLVPPTYLQIDNGKDYNAYGLATPVVWEGHEHSVLLDMGIDPKRALPFNPPAKPIEREFQAFSNWFTKLWPSHCGNRAGERPQRARDLRKTPEELPDLDEMTLAIGYFLQDHVNPKPRPSSKYLKGLSPDQMWARRNPEGRPGMDPRQFALALCLPEQHSRTVRPEGSILYQGAIYRHEALFGMAGREVYIRRPFTNASRLVLCRADGTVITTVEKQVEMPYFYSSDEDRKKVEDELATQRRILRQARMLARDRKGVLRVLPPSDPYELLVPAEARAQLVADRAARMSLMETAQAPAAPKEVPEDNTPLAAVTVTSQEQDEDMQKFQKNMMAMNDRRRDDEDDDF